MQAASNQFVRRIHGNGRGWTFSQADFSDLAGRSNGDIALHRLHEAGKIRRILRGLYDFPRYSELLQTELSPDLDAAAQALARKFGWRIQPDGETALNLTGLSTQVPARALYLSDGPTRRYEIGKATLEFRHRALKETGFRLRESGLIVQALKALGQERIDGAVIAKLREWLPEGLRAKVRTDTRRTTAWVYAEIVKITAAEAGG